MKDRQSVTNAISTGGGGTFFEQHVNALFLAYLLVRAIPPVLKDCQVEEVHLQTQHLGWRTDDALIIGRRGVGGQRQLAVQVKRRLKIAFDDEDCKKTFQNFWADFNASGLFNPTSDQFALVTLRGTNTLLDGLNGLLDCARASTDGADLINRLAIPGYLSSKARNYAKVIRKIIEVGEDEVGVSDDDFRRFLSAIHVLSLDLNTSTAQNEALVKSLLAHTARGSDQISTAEDTWRRLLELVGAGTPVAAKFTCDTLPVELRDRHNPVSEDVDSLTELVAHCGTTLGGISTQIINSVRIPRNALVTKILERLDESQVVVLTGPAGIGKSALAKYAIEVLNDNVYCLTFRAEEFAVSHIDQVLQQAQVSISGERLLALLAAQGRAVILVESVERLLESSVRESFSDLIRFAERDGRIQFILTCRDYSVDTVSSSLLGRADFKPVILEVPPLTDDELAQVASEVPSLQNALANPRLKTLLRIPYFLDMAARMDWSDMGDLPLDEREFRLRCWSTVVRREEAAGGGLPQRREDVFLDLALRRAFAMTPFVSCTELDPEIIEELRKDNLVIVSPTTDALVAPAHDVLEDWAVVQWLSKQFSLRDNDNLAFAEDIGGRPAIRRGFRKWLAELLECETERAESFVLSSFLDETLPAYFRDDILVCALLSTSARGFLVRHSEQLFAEDCRLLVRVIHLLRVACKTAPRWFDEGVSVPSQALVPTGEAWPAVLEIVLDGLDRVLPSNMGVVLGLLEDWALLVDLATPSPPGFHEAGKIAFALIDHLDGYHMDDLRKRTLEVIAKIPKADTDAFEDLIQRGCNLDHRDLNASEFANLLLTGVEGGFVCRDFPNRMAQLAMAQFCLSNADVNQDPEHFSLNSGELSFGIRISHLDFFPASAVRGPFLPLLQANPKIGVQLVIDLLNHACAWYGEQRLLSEYIEPPVAISIDIPGEKQLIQWANQQLWNLSRGISVGPYVLQTALMALEKWLLSICEIEGADVEWWLLELLRNSNNVAVTAVIASVCIAYPERGGRAALAVLKSREMIKLDRVRMIHDMNSIDLSEFMSFGDFWKKFYEDERRTSNALIHRRYDLEVLAFKLQLSAQRKDVWQILDEHRGSLPPTDKQSEEDRLWRLALHRMDIRGFKPAPSEAGSGGPESSPTKDSSGTRTEVLVFGGVDDDLQEIVDRGQQMGASIGADLALVTWAKMAWDRNDSVTIDVKAWEEKFDEAKKRHVEKRESEDFSRGGPSLIAAVSVRDHWEEMVEEDRKWCVARIAEEIEREYDSKYESVGRSRMGLSSADRPAAYVLSGALSENADDTSDSQLVESISKALTHPSSEVNSWAAAGIGRYMQGDWLNFALRCVGSLARQARLVEELQETESTKPFGERLQMFDLVRMVLPEVRDCIASGDVDVGSELAQLNLDGWPGRTAARLIMQILQTAPNTSLARFFYGRVAEAVVKVWDEKRDNHNVGHDFEFENECLMSLARFVLQLPIDDALAVCKPLIEAVDKHTKETSQFVKDLVSAEDFLVDETAFWEIWQAFADKLCKARWVSSLDSRYAIGYELVDAMFFGIPWKEGVRHWRRLEGKADNVDSLVEHLPPVTLVVQAYSRFLYEIGERSLPNGFVILADRLRAGNGSEILGDGNTFFYLESLLRRYVPREPFRLKSNQRVRDAVLEILDGLVDAGSSAAYRLRDDFVTPISEQS